VTAGCDAILDAWQSLDHPLSFWYPHSTATPKPHAATVYGIYFGICDFGIYRIWFLARISHATNLIIPDRMVQSEFTDVSVIDRCKWL
jgi:hypothetical protein